MNNLNIAASKFKFLVKDHGYDPMSIQHDLNRMLECGVFIIIDINTFFSPTGSFFSVIAYYDRENDIAFK